MKRLDYLMVKKYLKGNDIFDKGIFLMTSELFNKNREFDKNFGETVEDDKGMTRYLFRKSKYFNEFKITCVFVHFIKLPNYNYRPVLDRYTMNLTNQYEFSYSVEKDV